MLLASLSHPLRVALGPFTVKMKREVSGVNICFESRQVWARTQFLPSGQYFTPCVGSSGNTSLVITALHRLAGIWK